MELAEARSPARDLLARITAAANPADDIRREKQTPTFREFADEYAHLADGHLVESAEIVGNTIFNAMVEPHRM